MAKGGNKLTKLKSVLKKMQSFKINRTNDDDIFAASANSTDVINYSSSKDMHEVYVGKSRRRYLVSKSVVNHPLFRELVVRTGDSKDESIVSVRCEVVLFEHMIWMLQHDDFQQESSLGELVELYAY